MHMSFDYEGYSVSVDRFKALIHGKADKDPEIQEMVRNGVRVAIRERMVAEGKSPVDMPVIYAGDK